MSPILRPWRRRSWFGDSVDFILRLECLGFLDRCWERALTFLRTCLSYLLLLGWAICEVDECIVNRWSLVRLFRILLLFRFNLLGWFWQYFSLLRMYSMVLVIYFLFFLLLDFFLHILFLVRLRAWRPRRTFWVSLTICTTRFSTLKYFALIWKLRDFRSLFICNLHFGIVFTCIRVYVYFIYSLCISLIKCCEPHTLGDLIVCFAATRCTHCNHGVVCCRLLVEEQLPLFEDRSGGRSHFLAFGLRPLKHHLLALLSQQGDGLARVFLFVLDYVNFFTAMGVHAADRKDLTICLASWIREPVMLQTNKLLLQDICHMSLLVSHAAL